MLNSLDNGGDITMLAVEPPKSSHLPPNRRVAKLDGNRYIPVKDSDQKEPRLRSYNRKSFEKFDSVRDGAENRNMQRGGFVQKKPKISSQLDMPQPSEKRDALKVSRNVRGEFHAGGVPKGHDSEVLGVDNALWKKKGRSKPKKGVLKDAPESISTRVRQNNDRSNGIQKDLYGNMVIPERAKARQVDTLSNGLVPEKPGFERHVRDSTSYIDYNTAKKEEEDMLRRRLASASRPKSAGQAMYLSADMSDSDDSFYDGEIEIVDLDDPVFAYEREFEESRNAAKTNRTPVDARHNSQTESSSNRISGFPDDTENKGKQILHTSDNGSGLNRESSQSDYYDSYSMPPRPPTSRGRRRAQSEPEVEPLTVVRKNETRKFKQTFNVDKRLYQPLVRESLHTNTVDRVISKYSNMSVQKRNSNFPTQGLVPRKDTQIARAPLPRKLKPILRRDQEKIGQSRNEIDYQVSH